MQGRDLNVVDKTGVVRGKLAEAGDLYLSEQQEHLDLDPLADKAKLSQ